MSHRWSLPGLISRCSMLNISHCISFEDRPPVHLLCSIFKWVTETPPHDYQVFLWLRLMLVISAGCSEPGGCGSAHILYNLTKVALIHIKLVYHIMMTMLVQPDIDMPIFNIPLWILREIPVSQSWNKYFNVAEELWNIPFWHPPLLRYDKLIIWL